MVRSIFLCVVLITFLLQGAAWSAQPVKADPIKEKIIAKAKEYKNDIDPVIKDLLKDGADPRILVKNCIELGYEACKVATTAIREKADRQMVIFGALDGGATNEQLSLCEGLGYSYDPPASIEGLNPTTPKNPVSGSSPR